MKHRFQVFFALLAVLALSAPVFAIEFDAVEELEANPIPLDLAPSLVCGADVYNNTAATYFSSPTAPRWHVLDDGAFAAGTGPVTVECIDIGVNQTAVGNLTTDVFFYDTLTPAGPVCNATLLGGVRINWGSVPVGSFSSGLLSMTPPIVFPDDSWAVEIFFYSAVTPLTPSTTAGVLFANGGPTVGSNNAAAYYRDANANGVFECPSEARSFAAPNKAQFYLRLQAQVPPASNEASTWGNVKGLYR